MESFVYEPLDLTRNQIRLLRIEYAGDTSINCLVESFDQEQCPAYEALSYVWGSVVPVHSIKVNGKPFQIRSNLFHFLQHAAQHSIVSIRTDTDVYRPIYLWIDQLCIDQDSVRERNHQVQRMADIFQNAQRVVVWLGEATDESAATMRLIPNIVDFFESLETFTRGYSRRRAMKAKAQYHWFRKDNAGAITQMAYLFHNQYWLRIWAVQEFLQAAQLVLICGHDLLIWRDLGRSWILSQWNCRGGLE
jgi:hypothetical protein